MSYDHVFKLGECIFIFLSEEICTHYVLYSSELTLIVITFTVYQTLCNELLCSLVARLSGLVNRNFFFFYVSFLSIRFIFLRFTFFGFYFIFSFQITLKFQFAFIWHFFWC